MNRISQRGTHPALMGIVWDNDARKLKALIHRSLANYVWSSRPPMKHPLVIVVIVKISILALSTNIAELFVNNLFHLRLHHK